jgi:hypothetical protein
MTELEGILTACKERAGDVHQLLVAADWFADHNDGRMERCLRWMAQYEKWPHQNEQNEGYGHWWMWTCYGGLCGPRFHCGVNHALPRKLCRRIGFHEWTQYQTWSLAVNVLADALEQGWVECRGDPAQVDEETVKEFDRYAEEVRKELEGELS